MAVVSGSQQTQPQAPGKRADPELSPVNNLMQTGAAGIAVHRAEGLEAVAVLGNRGVALDPGLLEEELQQGGGEKRKVAGQCEHPLRRVGLEGGQETPEGPAAGVEVAGDPQVGAGQGGNRGQELGRRGGSGDDPDRQAKGPGCGQNPLEQGGAAEPKQRLFATSHPAAASSGQDGYYRGSSRTVLTHLVPGSRTAG